MLRFDRATYLSLLVKFVLSERFSNSLWGSDSLLFAKFMNIVSLLYYKYIGFVILLYSSLVISFARCKEYMICSISFSKFPKYYLLFFVQELLVIFETFT